ncbi:M56 family metallopeptidase [Psychroflexus planctonicus]|uniref:BlaR1 peptidase M56 n=1 Tax=Psychroflexus planctonicus TaxID=1526575 RepID=A0ABQ1SFU2_9FLAO|nr:M56 family metallopeptidase [Psychroflexus planctonicus]GGE37583.1 hypothetical protein GCM10010832_17270 [Psychroflexus planctonicus]
MPILIQILFYQGLFLLVYQLIKKEPFFQLNRFYLLFTLIASFALPFVEWNWFQFNLEQETFQKLNAINLPEVVIGNDAASTTKNTQQHTSIQYMAILENLYFLGFSIAVSLLYIKVEGLIQLIQENNSLPKPNCKLVYLKGEHEAFSFYNYVFIGEEICPKQQITILAHEQQHVKLKHSLDNSFVAALRVFMWFNPLLYYYQKELQLLHEYQADAKVCEQHNPKTYAWQLLNSAFKTKNMSLMSSFYHSSFIKNRITMLQKRNKNSQSIFKYAIVTPILLMAFSFNLVAQSSLPKDEQVLLEKYKKEIAELVEQGDMSVYYDYVINVEKDENNMLTKDAFYRMKAFGILANEKGMKPTKKLDKALLTEDYSAYTKRMNKRKEIVVMGSAKKENKKIEYNSDVPFASVDRVPIYPGCDESLNNNELRKCMSEKIQQHVNSNFKTSVASKLGIEGQTRIYVRFAIAKDGNIADVNARAAHPDLSDEGERVVNSLPKMKPGIHNKEAVNVIYTLPITLMVPEKEETEGK